MTDRRRDARGKTICLLTLPEGPGEGGEGEIIRASDFFLQDWWAEVTHGAKYGGSYFIKGWAQAYQTNHS